MLSCLNITFSHNRCLDISSNISEVTFLKMNRTWWPNASVYRCCRCHLSSWAAATLQSSYLGAKPCSVQSVTSLCIYSEAESMSRNAFQKEPSWNRFCTQGVFDLFPLSPGDPGLPGRAVLAAPGGGHVGRTVAEEVQVPRDGHGHRLRAARLLRAGERRTQRSLDLFHLPPELVLRASCVFRPRKATRRRWRRPGKSTRGATSPRPFSPSTSSGRTTGYGTASQTTVDCKTVIHNIYTVQQ